MSQYILVTGGAGYIGSHTVSQLRAKGEKVIVLDNLSTGCQHAVPEDIFIHGDVGDTHLVSNVLHQYQVDTVIHFAAHTIVPESVENPLKYYHNNTVKTQNLLSCCARANIRHFIFSSTAAVYGTPTENMVSEETPCAPINPYGYSKLMSEQMLKDLAAASSLRYTILRYFNVAGADHENHLGNYNDKNTTLVKVAAGVACGKRTSLKVFGTDFNTKDGTGVRDYIHVTDLAHAHINALDYLRAGGESQLLNCGYGYGYSVREIIASINRLSNKPITVEDAPRRPGDPSELIANPAKLKQILNWQPQFNDLDAIVQSSLRFEEQITARLPD